MSTDVLMPVLATLAVFVLLLLGLKFLNVKGKSFTFRVFTALGAGIVLGIAIQAFLGRGTEAATTVLDWMAIVGTGYVSLLQMLIMPLVFMSIVGAFTRSGVTNQFGKISGIVLGVLILRIIFAALTFLAIDSSLQYIIKGLIILVACSLDMRKYLVKK